MPENARVNWWKKVEYPYELKGYENLTKLDIYFYQKGTYKHEQSKDN